MVGDVVICMEGLQILLPSRFKKHLQKRSRTRDAYGTPIEMFPDAPWVSGCGRHEKELHEIFSSYMVRQKKEVPVGWRGGFLGLSAGACCVRFAGLGKNWKTSPTNIL